MIRIGAGLRSEKAAEVGLLPPVRQAVAVRVHDAEQVESSAGNDLPLQAGDGVHIRQDALDALGDGLRREVHGGEGHGPGHVRCGHGSAVQAARSSGLESTALTTVPVAGSSDLRASPSACERDTAGIQLLAYWSVPRKLPLVLL